MKPYLAVLIIVHLLLIPYCLAQPRPEQPGLGWNGSYRPAVNMLRQQDYQGAADMAKRLIDKNPKDFDAHYLLGRIAIHLKNSKQAIKHLSRSIKLEPNYPNPYFFRAMTLAKSQKSQAAIRDFKKATELAPKEMVYWKELSRYYASISNEDAAAASMATAKALSPKSPNGWFRLGEYYWRAADLNNASEAWKKSLEVFPNKKRARWLWRAHLRMGEYLYNRGELESALIHYNAIAEMRPHHTKSLEKMIQIHNQLGLYTQADIFRKRYIKSRLREIASKLSRVSRTPYKKRTPIRTFCVDQFQLGKYHITTNEFVDRRKSEALYTFFLARKGKIIDIISMEMDTENSKRFRLVHRKNKVSFSGLSRSRNTPPQPQPVDHGLTLKTYSSQPTYSDVKRDVIAALKKGL